MKKTPVKKIKIAYFSMMRFIETGAENWLESWYKYPPKTEKAGCNEIFATGIYGKNRSQKYIEIYKTPDVPVLDEKIVVDFVKKRATILNTAFEKRIPPPCDDSVKEWKCNTRYCPVFELCQKI